MDAPVAKAAYPEPPSCGSIWQNGTPRVADGQSWQAAKAAGGQGGWCPKSKSYTPIANSRFWPAVIADGVSKTARTPARTSRLKLSATLTCPKLILWCYSNKYCATLCTNERFSPHDPSRTPDPVQGRAAPRPTPTERIPMQHAAPLPHTTSRRTFFKAGVAAGATLAASALLPASPLIPSQALAGDASDSLSQVIVTMTPSSEPAAGFDPLRVLGLRRARARAAHPVHPHHHRHRASSS